MAEFSAYKETKLRGIRKTIAQRMHQSHSENAPVTLMRSVDITALQKVRAAKKTECAEKGIRTPSFNDMVLKAVALSLTEHKNLNATFQDGVIRTYEGVNLAMAVAIPAGLITPVIPDADKKDIYEISACAKDLGDRAKNGGLTVDDMTGGTFTLTNLGMLGIECSTPIINPPQVAIVAVGTVQPYLALQDGNVIERYKTFFSITHDHRIIDGYPAALFLQTLCEIMQTPERIWG